MKLTISDIAFAHALETKEQALAKVAQDLVQAGLTTADYLQGMRDREAQITTFLGNGIAIPHGTPQSRNAVIRTGVRVLVCPQGVDWGNGNQAQLIVGIAAQDNEHLDILRQLTHALSDDAVPVALAKAISGQQVLDILSGKTAPAEATAPDAEHFDAEATFTLRNPHGLHARPSAVLVNAVKQWKAEIKVENLDTRSSRVDARNLMRVVSMGAKQGHRLRFLAKGSDARAALNAIGEAFNAGLGEIAAQPQGLPPGQDNPKRSWLSRLFS